MSARTQARLPTRDSGPTVAEYTLGLKPMQMLRSLGEMGSLTVRASKAATRSLSWWPEAVLQASLAFRRCMLPMTLSLFVYVAGFGVILFGNVVSSLGLIDREPGTMYLIFAREIGLWVSMMVFAGVVGSAVTADLGARKVREELDAMSVLGVDVVRSLVVPRIVALTVSGVVIALVAVLVSVLANYAVAPAALGISPSLARDHLAYNIFPIDLYGAMARGLLIGFLIGVVSCHKGLSCKGGAEGVGRAVNQTVMISFVLVWVTNSLFNTAFLPLFPESLVLRG